MVNNFVGQIAYLHFDANLTPLQIAKFFLISENDLDNYEEKEREIIEYIQLVIEKSGKK